jgi:hypothetical protein
MVLHCTRAGHLTEAHRARFVKEYYVGIVKFLVKNFTFFPGSIIPLKEGNRFFSQNI